MLILGADPDQLDALALRISDHSDYYERLRHDIGQALHRTGWDGPDADRFRNTYNSRLAPQISQAASLLRSAQSDLIRNAAQQRKTSSIISILPPCRDNGAASESDTRSPYTGAPHLPSPFGLPLWPIGPFGPVGQPSIGPYEYIYVMNGVFEWWRTDPLGPANDIYDHTSNFLGFSSQVGWLNKFENSTSVGAWMSRNAVVKGVAKYAPYLAIPSAAYGIWNWKQDWQEATSFDSFAEGMIEVPDLFITAGSVITTLGLIPTPLSPVLLTIGLGISVGSGIVKLGGHIWQNSEEIADVLSEGLENAYRFGEDLFDTGAELVGDIFEAGSELVDDVVDAGTEFIGDVGRATVDVGRRVGSWLNPFD